MSIAEIKSMVAFVPAFLQNRCLQFGFHDSDGVLHRVVVGEDVNRIGIRNWERPINVSPRNPIWQALFLAPLVKEGQSQYKVAVTYPYSLRNEFEAFKPSGRIKLVLPDYQGGELTKTISLLDVWEVPEAYAHATAYHKVLKRDCVVISVGFGTIEMGMVDSTAQVFEPRLDSATYGLHKAAVPFRGELQKLGYDDSEIRKKDQDHVFDGILARVVDEIEGKPVSSPVNLIVRGGALTSKDLGDAARRVLTSYANEMASRISDYVEKQSYTANIDFVITGGGVNYPIVVDKIKETLAKYNLKNVTIATKEAAKYSAAIGITEIANRVCGNDPSAIGIDVGNNSVLYESADQIEEDELGPNALQQSSSSEEYTIQ